MELLALDLSTTVAGYAVFDKSDSSLKFIDFYRFISEDLVDRGKELIDLINAIYLDNPEIDEVAIEENLKSFRAGGTNASAMLGTAKINFLCQYFVKNIFKKNITEVNVMAARANCFASFHKIARLQKGVKHKEIAFKMVRNELGDDRFPKKVLKSGPRKGETVFVDEAMDMADSYVIGRAVLNMKAMPSLDKKIKKAKKI